MAENPNPAWVIEPFDRARHDRSRFDCGSPQLNDWLQKRSGQFGRKGFARTYVLVRAGEVVVQGYYAISTHSIVCEALPQDLAKGFPKIDVPTILIGRLAIDRLQHGQRLGKTLLTDALRQVVSLSKVIGVVAAEVDAIDENARRFYKKFGFLELRDDTHHLFLPVDEITDL